MGKEEDYGWKEKEQGAKERENDMGRARRKKRISMTACRYIDRYNGSPTWNVEQAAQLHVSPTNRAMQVCKAVEVLQDFCQNT